MISVELQQQLRQKYNPEGSELRTLQRHLLVLLRHFDKICKENNIRYWLSSGTCLGAVRHGGFIPWDDDIDIEMCREDYLKFKKVFKSDEDFLLQTVNNDLYYTQPFPKLRLRGTSVKEGSISKLYKCNGIFLDIFIMEPSNRYIASLCHFIVGSLRRLGLCFNKKRLIQDICFLFLKKMTYGTVNAMRVLKFFSSKDEMRHTLGTGVVNNVRKLDEIFPLRYMSFEGIEYPVPGNVDAYLKRMFGDYMSLPSEVHTHTFMNIQFLSDEKLEQIC